MGHDQPGRRLHGAPLLLAAAEIPQHHSVRRRPERLITGALAGRGRAEHDAGEHQLAFRRCRGSQCVEQVVGAQRERDGLVVMLPRVVIEAVDPECVLPQPDADELVDGQLVVRQGDPVAADRLVQAQRQPADARSRERDSRSRQSGTGPSRYRR